MDYSEWRLKATEYIKKCTEARNYALAIGQSGKREFKFDLNFGLFDDDSRLCYENMKKLISKGVYLSRYINEVEDLLEKLQKIGLHVNMRHQQVC
jgi:hypothetical protein